MRSFQGYEILRKKYRGEYKDFQFRQINIVKDKLY